MNPLQIWRLWRLYEEVKTMDTKALVKIVVCALLAGGTTAGAQYMASDSVNVAAVFSAVVTAIIAYLQKQPHA